MKKQKQLLTNYSTSNNDSSFLLKKVNNLLGDSVPKTILGMIALCKYSDYGILFYERWLLIPHAKHNYDIFDGYTQQTIYSNISLFSSALHIIYYLNKKVSHSCPKDKVIYALDQEYYRCLDEIRFYQNKVTGAVNQNTEMFAIKLVDKQHRLHEIKTRLSKSY